MVALAFNETRIDEFLEDHAKKKRAIEKKKVVT